MKKLLFCLTGLLLLACSADDAVITSEEVTLFVNHYKTTSPLSGTALVVQENETIGSDKFFRVASVTGFEFTPGFTYQLKATKTITKNAGTDARTSSYELIDIQQVNEVPLNETFSVPVSSFINGLGYVPYIIRTSEDSFLLGNEIRIDCKAYCDSMGTLKAREQVATGVFKHGPDNIYILTDLIL